MQIEAGKYYRTRDGRKVGPAKIHSAEYKYWDLGSEFDVCHEEDGTYGDCEPNSPHDLVAEWSEGPVRTVTRREVVPGTYGSLAVGAVINTPDRVAIDLSLYASLTADEIDTLVQHLTAIAEALRES